MSTVKINGRDVDFKNLNAEAVSFTANIAKLAHLDDPLPTGEDIGEEEFLELQSQLCHMHELPSKARSVMLAALCAGHSYRIAEALRKTSPDGQANMYAAYIQMLSLFPEGGQEPYFRMFLQSPEAKGLANLVAQSFIDGIKCFNPSGPGRICHLIIECLLWGETSDGDDRQACMDVKVRNDLEVQLAVFKGTDEWPRLRGFDQMCVDRLDGLLLIIRTVPGPDGHYLQSSKGYLIGGSGDDCCAGGDLDCNEAPSMRCARCKSVEYCGKKCQTKHWKAGHKLRCFSRVQ